MKKYIYLAVNDNNEGFICIAYNKKQMKCSGMNMKLNWSRKECYEKSLNELKCSNVELKNSSNVINFRF
jgi:hypothetical protein